VAITNSFGMPSLGREALMADIPAAQAGLGPGQVRTSSSHGRGGSMHVVGGQEAGGACDQGVEEAQAGLRPGQVRPAAATGEGAACICYMYRRQAGHVTRGLRKHRLGCGRAR
jgi:hypothetical protein